MQKNNTRSSILSAAVSLFSQRGYDGVSMKKIAQAVNISAPALYNHFKDKQSIYNAAVADSFENKAQPLQQALSGNDKPIVRLQRFITSLCKSLADDPEFRRLVQRELLDEDEERLRHLAEDIFAPLFESMMDLLSELKPAADTHMLAVIIIGMVLKPYEFNPLGCFLSGSLSKHNNPVYISQQVMELLDSYLGET